jgi:hypothetical protein
VDQYYSAEWYEGSVKQRIKLSPAQRAAHAQTRSLRVEDPEEDELADVAADPPAGDDPRDW